MALVVTVTAVDKVRRMVHITFTDSVSSALVFENDYNIPRGAPTTWLADTARDEIANLSARETVTAGIVTGVVTPTPPVVDPNAAVKATFAADLAKLRELKVLVDLGIKLATDADYVAQIATVKADWTANGGANQVFLLPLIR